MASTLQDRPLEVLVPERRSGTASGVHIMSLVMHLLREAQEPEGKAFDNLIHAIGAEVFIACNGWPEPGAVAYRWGEETPEVIAAAWRAYREAFDECAGPQQFRHGTN